ncbi:UxaA family hydrolase [Tepidanaerobacter acetatoxydans]|uniref:UxaA family hydrolase n=1 Tax=Tepidanaerobacter acetatoxydans TaxID=499229 RepID=UPI001BD6438B|nr:UxaA family hydrolase [Tepidanaerobacter acetatoxydans]
MKTFMGYERPDQTVGVRNYVAILPTVCCSNPVAEHIARNVPGSVALCHGHGCGRRPERQMHTDVIIGLGTNPNVFGTIVVSLGCEGINAADVAEAIRKTGRPVELLIIQEQGSKKTTELGIKLAERMVAEAQKMQRREFPVSKLMLGLECGGSDAMSGVTSNPAIGTLADWLVEQNGTTVLTETTEFIGTSSILGKRACNEEIKCQVEEVIKNAQANTYEVLGKNAARAISPGNMDGGMSTIQEKSLGCIRKGGTTQINEVVGYGEKPTKKGLVIMEGPGFDTESMTGMAAMGCQIIIFSTGRGNPIGFPIVPVIKVASNDNLYKRMQDDIDVNAGKLLGNYTFSDIQKELIDLLIRVADGAKTKAEQNDQGGMVCIYAYSRSL